MIRREVIFSPEARDDLIKLYHWIAGVAGSKVAFGYTERIGRFCLGFEFASERGHSRDDIRAGLRIVGFERRVTIAFTVSAKVVTIVRVFYGGQNWEDKL